jgi:hypothetical protein
MKKCHNCNITEEEYFKETGLTFWDRAEFGGRPICSHGCYSEYFDKYLQKEMAFIYKAKMQNKVWRSMNRGKHRVAIA